MDVDGSLILWSRVKDHVTKAYHVPRLSCVLLWYMCLMWLASMRFNQIFIQKCCIWNFLSKLLWVRRSCTILEQTPAFYHGTWCCQFNKVNIPISNIIITLTPTIMNKTRYIVHKLNLGSHCQSNQIRTQSDGVIKARVQVMYCINVKPKSEKGLGF